MNRIGKLAPARAAPWDDATWRCPLCHDGVAEGEVVACRACLALHHAECWRELRRCATCQDARGLTDAPPDPRAARALLALRVLAGMVAALLVAALVVFAVVTVPSLLGGWLAWVLYRFARGPTQPARRAPPRRGRPCRPERPALHSR